MSFLPAPTLVAAAMATSSPTQSAAATVPVAGFPITGTAENSEPGVNAPSAAGASHVTEGSPSKLASGERRGSSIVASAFGLSEGGPGLGGSFPQQPFPVAGFPVGGLTVVGGPVSGSAGGGGLASSPNVPKPGTSIDPATGKPHTAGLTRAELEAKKASAAAELSGREQAAKQLTGGLGEAAITPGKELPGGWGPIKPVAAPGTGPNATTSIEEDIENALNKVGQAAFSLVPNSVKEALGNSPTSKTGATPGTSPTARRGSGAGFLDAAMQQANKLTHDLTVSGKKATEFVGAQVKELVDELKTAPGNRLSMSGPGEVRAVGATAVAPRTSLPSDEPAGALPGEHTSGVGALPGPSTETGVAVLPDEKNIASSSSLQNQAPRPGEVAVAPRVSLPSEEPAGALPSEHTTGAGALPGSADETGVAVLPEERAHPDPLAEFAASAAGASRAVDSAASAPSSGIHPGIGLAAPLPAAPLGEGAAGGATDLEATPGVSTASVVSAPVTDSGSPTTPNGHSGGVVPETRHANDRTTSMASVTAIRAGHEGERPSEGDVLDRSSATSASPLSKTAIVAGAAAATAAGGGAAAVGVAHADKHAEGTGASGTKQAVSLTPGNEHEAVGHPSMRDTPGATRTPGTYPAADLNGKAEGTEKVINKTTTAGHHDTTTAASAAAPTTIVATPAAAKSSTTTPNGTTAAAKITDDTQHRRKSSGASATKKKVGFMHKLKGEMKVISGKLTKDESKVEVGEKMKHGEL